MYENVIGGDTTETVAVAPSGYRERPRQLRRIGIAYDGPRKTTSPLPTPSCSPTSAGARP